MRNILSYLEDNFEHVILDEEEEEEELKEETVQTETVE